MASQALLDADTQARIDATDVKRSFIVQAPAGSGKTELLIQRYLALLAAVDSPEEVLAITFTVKAAAEMRERVVQSLKKAQSGDRGEQEYQQVTFDFAAAVLQRDIDNDWNLLSQPRRMRIQTLDAFSSGTARSLPVTAGLGSAAKPVQGAEAVSLYRAASLATLDWLVDGGAAGTAVETVLAHLDNNTASYVTYLSAMLQSRDQWLAIVGSGEMGDAGAVRAGLERTMADIVATHLRRARQRLTQTASADVVELLNYAAENLLELDAAAELPLALSGRTALAEASSDELNYWLGLTQLCLTNDGSWRRRLTKNEGFPPRDAGQKKRWQELLGQLAEDPGLASLLHGIRSLPPIHYSDSQWAVMLSLFQLLPGSVSELKRIFNEQGICDHAEVALAAAVALGSAESPGDIALMLDYRIRHLLVDEMQDTSISQYQMLETLTAGWQVGDGRSFFCVGDPMQSIYRFRNAEVGQFIQAREAGLGQLLLEPLTLRRNFRSGERLVHWFNTIFAQIFPPRNDRLTGAVGYTESEPVTEQAGRGAYVVHALQNADPIQEAEQTAEIIVQVLHDNPGDELAILVRSRTQLPALLNALRVQGIDYQAVEIDRLTDLPETIELQALTRALCHPGDRAAWLALMRGPLVGLSWEDLHTLLLGAAGESVWALLQDKKRTTILSPDRQPALQSFLQVMRESLATDRVLSLRDRVEQAWLRLGVPALLNDEQQLANAYRFFAVIEQAERAGTLADPASLLTLLDNERVSSSGGENCRVQVMTMHKAKGLQFDHVLLPSLGRHTSQSAKGVLSWINAQSADGVRGLLISPLGASFEAEQDALYQYIAGVQKSRDQLEQDRLLYVACTRAKKSLHLVGHVVAQAKGDAIRKPHSGSLLCRLWPAVEAELQARFNPEQELSTPGAQGGDDDQEILRRPERQVRPGKWQLPATPAMPGRTDFDSLAADIPEHTVEYYWVGAIARHSGTVVHRWLHRFVSSGQLPAVEDLPGTDEVSRLWAQAQGVAAADLDTVCARVRLALAGILEDPQGRWLLEGEGAAELPITGVVAARPRSIVIDRVRIDNRTHWIVDYKTSVHEGGDLEQFLAQEAQRYLPQLARYAKIYRDYSGADDVRAALYFPMMQRFVEISGA